MTLTSIQPVEDFSTWESAVKYPRTFAHGPSGPQSRDTGYCNHAGSNGGHCQHSEHNVANLNPRLSGIKSSSTGSRPNNFFKVVHLRKTNKFALCLISSDLQLASSLATNVQINVCTNALSAKKWACKACNYKSQCQRHFNKSKSNKYQGQAHVTSDPSFSGGGSGDGDYNRPSSSLTEPSSNPQLTRVLADIAAIITIFVCSHGKIGKAS